MRGCSGSAYHPPVSPEESLRRLSPSSEAAATLLEAVLSVGRDLDLTEVLTRIVKSACEMVGAHYGALGVLRPDGEGLMEFLTCGLTIAEIEGIGAYPKGEGVLGLLVREPRPIRLADLREHPSSVGFPPGHPVMKTFLGAPVRVRGEVFGNLYLTDKVGGLEFTAEDEALVVALAAAAGMAIDNARLFETTRRQQQWADALGAMSRALLSGRDHRDALGLLAERACAAAEADMAVIALLEQEGSLVVEAATGPDGRARAVVGTPLTEPHWSTILESGEPLLLLSREGEAAADPPAGLLRGAIGLAEHGQTAVVPMTVGGAAAAGAQALGLLIVGWDGVESHVAYDAAEPLKQYADQAAVTLTAAYAQRDRARMVVLEDRERIARDMHDLVIQRLFATGLGLQSATRVAGHPYVQRRLSEAVDELDRAIRDIRQMIFALNQPDHELLTDEVHELAAGFVDALGFQPAVDIAGALDDVTGDLRLDLIAVVREALSNVARHAQAHRAGVDIAVGAVLRVSVEDDGVGYTDTGRQSGLANLRARAEHHGGSVVVIAPVDALGGTRLVWEVPMTDAYDSAGQVAG